MYYDDKQYSRRLGGFHGADFSSSPANVAPGRFAYLVNMYRDYDSEQGDATETVPGFRRLAAWAGKKVNGIFTYKPAGGWLYILVHAGTSLYRFKHSDRDNLSDAGLITEYTGLADAKSSSVMLNNKLYILDGSDYWVYDGDNLTKVTAAPYLPVTYINGEQYEQRNMLNNQTINRDTEMLDCNFAELLDVSDSIVTGWKEGYSGEWLVTATGYHGIGPNAFKNDTALQMVHLGGNNQRLSESSFEGCTALTEVRLSGSSDYNAPSICPNAFKNCTALKKVYLDGLMEIGTWHAVNGYHSIFDGCTAIQTVYTSRTSDEWSEYEGEHLSSFFPTATIVYQKGAPTISTVKHAMVYDPADSIASVKVDGEAVTGYGKVWHTIDGETYVDRIVTLDEWTDDVDILLNCKPSKFTTYEGHIGFLDGNTDYSGTVIDAITKCRLIASYDGRVFFSGNPNLPNTVLYAQRDLTGFSNPTYVGVLNYVNDGTGASPNAALLPASGMLMVLKGDTIQDGSVYYHTGSDTGSDIIPRIYPSTQGVAGLGCVGAAVNFLDDPVFLSKRGLEAIGKQQVNLERTVVHRSYNVDRELAAENLAAASLAEWRGYLCVFCPSGNVYLADSRQITEHPTGAVQYEWYRLEGIGIYAGQTQDYKLTTGRVEAYDGGGDLHWLNDTECWVNHDGERRRLNIAPGEDFVRYSSVYSSYVYAGDTGAEVYYSNEAHTEPIAAYVAEHDGLIYLVEPDEDYCPFTGGEFKPALTAAVVDEVLYFGTVNGDVCCFNNDMRGKAYGGVTPPAGTLHPHWYTYNGRTIVSALSTAYDDAGYPDLAKKTVSKSLVIHTKVFGDSRFSVNVRTDRTDEWKRVGEISNSTVDFSHHNFANTSLKVTDDALFTVREKEKKWAKKQLYFASERHMSPWGLYSIGYRFMISGRIRS